MAHGGGCSADSRTLGGKSGRGADADSGQREALARRETRGARGYHRLRAVPHQLKEAPQLAELVKAGKLPPVAERIGPDPIVVKPLHTIGTYGGTWRRGFTGPADTSAGQRVNESDHLTYFDYTGTHVRPNIAKSWVISDAGRTITFHLRRGMKWSDGHPFTADDFVFWFEDMYQHKDLIATPSPYFATNGKQGTLVKVDDLHHPLSIRRSILYPAPSSWLDKAPSWGIPRKGVQAWVAMPQRTT